MPWSSRQTLPYASESIAFEQTYPTNGHSSRKFRAVVKQIGLRILTVELSPDDPIGSLASEFPPPNSGLIVSFLRDGQLYTFESAIQKVSRVNGSYTIVLRRPKRVVKVQRRFSYRLPVETRTSFRRQQLGLYYDDPQPAKIVNLSEGGMMITTSSALTPGVLVLINVPAGVEGDTMDVEAEVLEVAEDFRLRQETVLARLRFDGSDRVKLESGQRALLVEYLIYQQRLMLQARRLLNTAKKR